MNCTICKKPLGRAKSEPASGGSGRAHSECRRKRQRLQTCVRVSLETAIRLDKLAALHKHTDTRLGPVLDRLVRDGVL